MSLDLAALARSLRLPPSALRIVDLSSLAPAVREIEAAALGKSAAFDLPPQLRMRVEGLSEDAPAPLDWLVFAPDLPRKPPEKVYGSALEYWADRALPPPPELPASAGGSLRRRLLELDAEIWAELRARAAWEGVAPAALLVSALADTLAAWSRDPRFTIALQLTGTPGGLWVPLELDGAALGPFAERTRAVQERLRRDLAWPLPRSMRPEGLTALPVAASLPPGLFKDDNDSSDGKGGGRGRPEPRSVHLQVAEREGGLLLFWDLAEAALPEGMADALTVAFRDLLRRLSAEPAWREVRRRLIPPQQLARMVAFNTTGAPLPEPYLYELFAARARRQPDRIAAGSVTYGELLRTSERLGHLLQRQGARRNTPVAVVLEPGPDAIAAVLGVLAAGAAYLPIDPCADLRTLLEHGRIELAVTREALADILDWPDEIVGVMMEDIATLDLSEGPPPVPSASPKDLACVLSGVMLENRGIANLVVDLSSRFRLGPGDQVRFASPLWEGPSLFEIFGTLAAGATLATEGRTAVPEQAALRGSLETTVWAMASGRPISNMSVHILDARLELCPFWVPGDLYIGGIGLARGYWRDPARSAERFAIHPDTGERLFRSGWRARWVAGGEVELL
ncbi:MAG TPA: AMP-binding protein [Thermoanaerobaculia bacterium]|nr:AMP-binding protein [Thermoanaerobaculia bacterium]